MGISQLHSTDSTAVSCLDFVVNNDPGDDVRCLDGGMVRGAFVTSRHVRLVACDCVKAARIRLDRDR